MPIIVVAMAMDRRARVGKARIIETLRPRAVRLEGRGQCDRIAAQATRVLLIPRSAPAELKLRL